VIGERRRVVHHTWSIHHCDRVRGVVVRSPGQSWCLVRGDWPLSFGMRVVGEQRDLSQDALVVYSRLDLPLTNASASLPPTNASGRMWPVLVIYIIRQRFFPRYMYLTNT
jgi:hypothetical protein